MALNGDTRRSPECWNGNPPMHSSFDSWVNKYGKDAYKDFKKEHPKTGLSYEGWRRSDQVYGGYLFHVASLVWNEDGDSDEERAKRRRISRVPDDNPKKTATVNGNGALHIAGSATPTPTANSDEISASGKRKRKPRKKYMSQELVGSDEELADEVEAATPSAEAETAVAPETTVNGQRKSTSRKPRKKPISDETILLEDENDDPMEVDAHAIGSPLPVRSAPHISATTRQSESPKKATPKQASVRKSRKSFLVRLPFHLWDAVNLEEKSEEMVLNEDTDNEDASMAEVLRPATTPAAKSKPDSSNDIKTDTDNNEAADIATVEGTPDLSAANTRRGLRNRKPAQQRPYYHDAQVFEDVETDTDDESEPEPVSRELSVEGVLPSKPKHFKGKGRAWKKDGSDEDEEFTTPKEKKAAKTAKAKLDKEKVKGDKENANEKEEDPTWALWALLNTDASEVLNPDKPENHDEVKRTNGSPKDQPKQKKKTGRPRKSRLSEDIVRNESDNDTQAKPTQPPKRGRGRPRKSALSSEIVRDDTEDEAPAPVPKQVSPDPAHKAAGNAAAVDLTTLPKTKTTSRPSTATSIAPASTPKKRGRPRKSEANTTPAKASAKANENADGYKPQRRASTATEPAVEPTTTRTRASISSAPDVRSTAQESDYPMPNMNPGAALIESLYPREQQEPSRASSVSTPAPAPAPTPAPAPAPAAAFTAAPASAEKPTFAASPAAEELPGRPETHEQADKEANEQVDEQANEKANEQADKEANEQANDQANDQANEQAKGEAEAKPETTTEVTSVKDEDDGEMSAAMSLSSDGEL